MTDTLKYGPQTAEVEALLERARTLTDVEVLALGAVRGVVPDAALYTALYAAWDAVLSAAWGAARDAALYTVWNVARGSWDEVWDAVWDAVGGSGRDAALDAAYALFARDLITPAGFTQAHYDLLTGPWRRVVGAVHPNDVVVAVV